MSTRMKADGGLTMTTDLPLYCLMERRISLYGGSKYQEKGRFYSLEAAQECMANLKRNIHWEELELEIWETEAQFGQGNYEYPEEQKGQAHSGCPGTVHVCAETENESDPTEVDKDSNEIIVISSGKYRIGLQVDKIASRQEIFIRDINKELMKVPGFGGASILGNGSIVIILDCENIISIAENNSQTVSELKKASGL